MPSDAAQLNREMLETNSNGLWLLQEEHKKETKEYEESVKEQEASADHLKEMTLARCVGAQSSRFYSIYFIVCRVVTDVDTTDNSDVTFFL